MSVTSTIFFCIFLLHRTCRSEPLAGMSEPANPNEFPFVVSIARKFDITTENPYGHICGGALINRKHVLTAASCFAANRSESDYLVYVGSNDLASSVKIDIEKLTTYDMWLRHTNAYLTWIFNENDIAIIKLSQQVMSKIAKSAKMLNITPTDLENKDVITAGWGLKFNDIVPRYMFKANLNVINKNQCLQNVRIVANDATYMHEKNFFCTKYYNFFVVLDEGDRGSPVFLKDESGNYRIVGINQKSVPPVDNVVQMPDQQNKHVNIYYYFDFIRIVSNVHPLQN